MPFFFYQVENKPYQYRDIFFRLWIFSLQNWQPIGKIYGILSIKWENNYGSNLEWFLQTSEVKTKVERRNGKAMI